jgi:2-desacetyl-2-hydroxyethyl bacteriochlorophyllide A dehydrogenase
MKQTSLVFLGPGKVDLKAQEIPVLAEGQVLVQNLYSAISPGTELLIYRGQIPEDLPADENLPDLPGDLAYPLTFGYAAVGRVIELGPGVPDSWQNRRVFAFHPHADVFVTTPDHLHPIPEDLSTEDALFFPNMETALSFLHDGQPILGEQVLVLGQGIVGLLTTTLLGRLPLGSLVTVDRYPLRRRASLEAGAHLCLDPSQSNLVDELRAALQGHGAYAGADLVYELTGDPAALDAAVAAAGYEARVVVGSWYGTKTAPLNLGTHFHRHRIRLLSSQVSTLQPALRGRWDKARRLELVWDLLQTHRPSHLITHRFPFEQAAQAYAQIDQQPQETIQTILAYGETE